MSTGPVSVGDLEWTALGNRDGDGRHAGVTARAGGEDLGCTCHVVPAGERGRRPHYHLGNEEAVYVLAGDGTIRLGPDGDPHALGPGAYVALPEGPTGTHEVVADGDADLRLLVFSTMQDPDVTVFPADGEATVTAGGPPGTALEDRLLSETVELAPPAVDAAALPEPGPRVVPSESLAWTDYEHGERTFRRRHLGAAAGGDRLGCSSYDVPPGKTTWLRHWHGANEEALYVLEGGGTIRLGAEAEEYDLSPEDYVALPADERGTHEVAAGEDGLRYLVASEMVDPEVTCYPDRDMLGIYVGSAPGGDPDERRISAYLDRDAELAYWDDG